MSRFLLSAHAQADLEVFSQDLDSFSRKSGDRMARSLYNMLNSIAEAPFQGPAHSGYTLLFGYEIRSRLVGSYRVYYRFVRSYPENMGVIHGARDHDAIMAGRLT